MIYGITVLFSFLFLKLFSIIKTPILSDIPNERSMHSLPVKRSAGIVFFGLFWIIIIFLSSEKNVFNNDFFFIYSCTLFFSILGFLDDIKNLSSKIKLILEIFFIFVVLLIYPSSYSILTFEMLNFNYINIFILTIYIVFISNLCNFMDGLDLYLSITYLIFIINFTIFNNFIISDYLNFLIYLLFSMSSFYYFNSPNAKMFMGDSGSLPLGFLIGISPLYSNVESLPKDLSLIILFIPLFIIDGVFTLIRRIIGKKYIFSAHREHLYQRVQIELGWSKWRTLFVFTILNVVPCIFYFMLREFGTGKLGIILSFFLLFFIYIRIFLQCEKLPRPG